MPRTKSRPLSAMWRSDRLLAKAIARCFTRPTKARYMNDRGTLRGGALLPKEWA